MTTDSPTFFDRLCNWNRYEQGVRAFNGYFFQFLEWLVVVGALQFIGTRFDSDLTLAVAFVAMCALSLQLSMVVTHAVMGLVPTITRFHWAVATLLTLPVLLGFYYLMRRVFDDVVAGGV